MGRYRTPKEVKEQVLKRIKEGSVSVSQAAKEHGVSENTIYNWLSKGLKGQPTLRDFNRLQRENRMLTELVGKLTVKLSHTQKKK